MKNLPPASMYPKKIYYRDETYKLKFVKNFYCFGETDGDKKTIKIKKGMSRRETLSTLIHELMHVIEFELPLKIKHKNVHKLEKAFMELLLDNFL